MESKPLNKHHRPLGQQKRCSSLSAFTPNHHLTEIIVGDLTTYGRHAHYYLTTLKVTNGVHNGDVNEAL